MRPHNELAVYDMPVLFPSKDRAAQPSAGAGHRHSANLPCSVALAAAACHKTAQLPRTRARAAMQAMAWLRDSRVHYPRLRVRSHAKPTATRSSRTRPVDSLSEISRHQERPRARARPPRRAEAGRRPRPRGRRAPAQAASARRHRAHLPHRPPPRRRSGSPADFILKRSRSRGGARAWLAEREAGGGCRAAVPRLEFEQLTGPAPPLPPLSLPPRDRQRAVACGPARSRLLTSGSLHSRRAHDEACVGIM